MSKLKLGINTGFALNRYPMPYQWMKVVGSDLDLRFVQLTADLINPCWGEKITDNLIVRIEEYGKQYNVSIESVMTGAFTRVNHFSHPDEKMREYWMEWFKDLADIAARLGAKDLSSHLGILCYDDLYDKKRREHILKETVSSWKALAEYAKDAGLKSLSWEPMSISREYGETIAETRRIQDLMEGSAIPIRLCLDVDHGDMTSKNPKDLDYRNWLKTFAGISPYIHLKQSLTEKGGHYPFTAEYNSKGKITPKEFFSTLKESKVDDALLLLELSFREREPTDSRVLQALKESSEYWKKGLSDYEKGII